MCRVYSMMDIAPTVSVVLGLSVPSAAKGTPITEVVDDLRGASRIALLVPDALGWYAWRLWHQEMPFLSAQHSVRSLVLRSVMPSITPVNFATMVTGTDLAGHGIHTYDDHFQCETLFDLVRAAGQRSAAIGFEGYTGSRLLGRFADIDGVTALETDDWIADRVIEIAREHRPAFVIAQLGRVDDVFHRYGPSSPEVVPMLRDTDARLDRLTGVLTKLGYGVVILSDHGQHDIPGELGHDHRGGHGSDRDEDRLVPCTWVAPWAAKS